MDRMCGLSKELAGKLEGGEGVRVLFQGFNQCLVRIAGGDGVTRAVVEDVVAGGEIFIGATAWEGLLAVRLSVCNWAMQLEDVEVAAAAILRSVDKVRAG